MRQQRGTTIFELLILLCFVSILLSIALPTLRSSMDALAARAARESAFALFSRARVIAWQNGGAEIFVDPAQNYIAVRTAAGAIERDQHFIHSDLIVEGVAAPLVLRYDAYGLGRMMSRTIQFHTRSAKAGLTVSSFGRVRRW